MARLKWLSLLFGYIVMTCMSIDILVDAINRAEGEINKLGMILLTCGWVSMLALGFMLLIHAKQEDDE
jgi:hypothetical protein